MTEHHIEDAAGEPWTIVVRSDVQWGLPWVEATDENTVCHETNVWWEHRIFSLKDGEQCGYGVWF